MSENTTRRVQRDTLGWGLGTEGLSSTSRVLTTVGYAVVSCASLLYAGVFVGFYLGAVGVGPLTTEANSIAVRVMGQVEMLASSFAVIAAQVAFVWAPLRQRLNLVAVNVVTALAIVVLVLGLLLFGGAMLWGVPDPTAGMMHLASWLTLPLVWCLPAVTMTAGTVSLRLTIATPPRWRTAAVTVAIVTVATPFLILVGSYYFTTHQSAGDVDPPQVFVEDPS